LDPTASIRAGRRLDVYTYSNLSRTDRWPPALDPVFHDTPVPTGL